ncbi:MAG: HEAT repeat domain-containing protein [Candidatus Hodarchaeales archaeon]
MPAVQNDIWEKMVQKVLHGPDKFERMFAARYLSKYKYTEIKTILIELLEDDDLEVVKFVARILQENGESF